MSIDWLVRVSPTCYAESRARGSLQLRLQNTRYSLQQTGYLLRRKQLTGITVLRLRVQWGCLQPMQILTLLLLHRVFVQRKWPIGEKWMTSSLLRCLIKHREASTRFAIRANRTLLLGVCGTCLQNNVNIRGTSKCDAHCHPLMCFGGMLPQ